MELQIKRAPANCEVTIESPGGQHWCKFADLEIMACWKSDTASEGWLRPGVRVQLPFVTNYLGGTS